MNDFYRLPAEQSIHHSKLYTEGLLYGMDMSSGYAVKALGLEDNLHVLELCCAPGNKLMYIRDLMKGGSVTGVDISQPRMEVTRSLIKKYGHEHTIKLYCEDATTFKTLN
jgi:16S rRNA C967 or C1407 C5-methylase (RsmB/RsmF family)